MTVVFLLFLRLRLGPFSLFSDQSLASTPFSRSKKLAIPPLLLSEKWPNHCKRNKTYTE